MTLSARNKLKGQIEEIIFGDVMALVVVRVGTNRIESVITRRSAEELKLKKGDTVAAVVKATEVMIQKDQAHRCLPAIPARKTPSVPVWPYYPDSSVNAVNNREN